MNRYLKEHEKYIQEMLSSEKAQDWDHLITYHKTQIQFLQHERFVHLFVMLFVILVFLSACMVTTLYPMIEMLLIDLILGVLLLFYVLHYFKLENGVQRWYRIYNELCKKRNALLKI